MQFTAPVPLDEAAEILRSYQQESRTLSHTVVEVVKDDEGASAKFSVKREGKGSKGVFQFMVVEINGTLTATSDQLTAVTANARLGKAMYALLALIVVILVVGAQTAGASSLGWIVLILFAIMFGLDALALVSVIDGLQKGQRRRE